MPRLDRLCATLLFAFVGAIALAWPPGPAVATDPPDGELLAKIIPNAPGKKVCFSGTFRNVPISSETYGAAPGKDAPVPIIYHPHNVTAVTLQLEYMRTPPRPPTQDDVGWDRQYGFLLAVRLADRARPVFAAGECWWHDRDVVTGTESAPFHLPRNTSELFCHIECDGGGMSVVRVANMNAVKFRIDAKGRLRMTASCGGNAEDDKNTLVFAGREAGVEFRLAPARASACRPLERWLKGNN